MEGPAQVWSERKYGQLYTCTQHSSAETSKHGTWSVAARQPRRLCYRPTLFFRHFRLTVLSLPQGNIRQGFQTYFIFSACAKYRKVTISFVMSVRLEQLGSHRTDFHEMLYFLISSFRRVQNVVCFLLVDSVASDLYMLTFRNTLSVPSSSHSPSSFITESLSVTQSLSSLPSPSSSHRMPSSDPSKALLMQHFLKDLTIMLLGMAFHAADTNRATCEGAARKGGWRKGAD